MPGKIFRSFIFSNTIMGAFIGLIYAWLIAPYYPLPTISGALTGAIIGWGIQATGLSIRDHGYRIPLHIISALLTFYIVIPIFSAYFSVHPSRYRVDVPATTLSAETIEISLKTQDGINISGWYQPSTNGIVFIVIHGNNANRLQVLPQARVLLKEGFGVVLLDLRGHGNSEGSIFSPCRAKDDVAAALEFVQSKEHDAVIGVYGIGLGAHAGICAAAEHKNIQALVVDGVTFGKYDDIIYPRANSFKAYNLLIPAYGTYTNAVDFFSNTKEPALQESVMRIFPRPIMFIAAEKDILEPDQARRYMAFACSASTAWNSPEATRQNSFHTNPDQYTEQMIGFIYDQLEHAP